MEREGWEKLFCNKIFLELAQFKHRMLQRSPEDIFAAAYEIDVMVSMYEILAEQYERIGLPVLKRLLTMPDLLSFLYEEWLKTEDSWREELRGSVEETLQKLCGEAENLEEEMICLQKSAQQE